MDLVKLNKAIESNGEPVEVSALINLMTCTEIKLMSGRVHERELEWVYPQKPSFLTRLFYGTKERKPYLQIKNSPWFYDDVYASVEDFNEKNYPKLKANSDLTVDHNPCIVIFHGDKTITNIYYDAIEDAENMFNKIKEKFESANVPKLIKEKYKNPIKEDSALETQLASMDVDKVNKSLDLMQRLDAIDEEKKNYQEKINK